MEGRIYGTYDLMSHHVNICHYCGILTATSNGDATRGNKLATNCEIAMGILILTIQNIQ